MNNQFTNSEAQQQQHRYMVDTTSRPIHYARPKVDPELAIINSKREAEYIEQEREKNRCAYENCPEPYSKYFCV